MDETQDGVQIGENKFITKATVLSHLKTYNLYYEGQNLKLRHREEEGELIVEGLLNISWGLRRPIRLQMQDDHERIRPPPSSTSWHSGCNLDSQGTEGQQANQQNQPTVEVTAPENQPEDNGVNEDQTEEDNESSAQLLRTKSDAGFLRRGQRRSPSDQRKIRRHRFSINGHFYNHKTAVFTPAYGSVTNVRINSCMTTPQVLRVLLNKFKIENSPDDFALYLVHASGERVKLKRSDYPLVLRVMQGPCEQVCKVFLMEEDLGEEVTYDVAQYIKFEMPVLKSFITKLKEEEDREVQKLRRRYNYLRCIIEKQIRCVPDGATFSRTKIMPGLQKLLLSVALCLLLLATLLPSSEARRDHGFGSFNRDGGGYSWGWGGGGGQAYRPVQTSGSSAGKVAGAAAAGAIGGAMLGSALSRPGYGYGYGGGYGGGYGSGYGYPRHVGNYGPRPGYEPEGSGDMEYYTAASSGPIYNSIIVVIGSLMSLLMGHWVAVM
ncbi:hypothetical protein LDENG_00162030 [Lucifuga dentata]|nr:hypothetical protein LDENG_00162030 [Lucifuga dentata]